MKLDSLKSVSTHLGGNRHCGTNTTRLDGTRQINKSEITDLTKNIIDSRGS